MQYAGQSNLKRVYLECGGKSPNLIFADCKNLDRVAEHAAAAIFHNQGEVCIAGSRLLVENTIRETFVDKVLAAAERMQPGDPLDPASFMGAIVDRRSTPASWNTSARAWKRARPCAPAARRWRARDRMARACSSARRCSTASPTA